MRTCMNCNFANVLYELTSVLQRRQFFPSFVFFFKRRIMQKRLISWVCCSFPRMFSSKVAYSASFN